MFDGCGEMQVLGFSRHNGLSLLTSATLRAIQRLTRRPTWQGHLYYLLSKLVIILPCPCTYQNYSFNFPDKNDKWHPNQSRSDEVSGDLPRVSTRQSRARSLSSRHVLESNETT
jgi:hypothetical protein